MLKLLQGSSERKLRLLACAFCRRLWPLLTDDDGRAVEVAERYAEGFATDEERDAARRAEGQVSRAAGTATFAHPWAGAWMTAAHAAEAGLDAQAQCDLIREVFGNPFRSVPIDAGWLIWNSRTIPKLGQAIYDEPAFDRLAVLADALEDAGCTVQAILEHLRGPGPHVRGCWALDLILGKT
jgi:hypothetical protein